jgi:hypothetical protein
VTAVMEATAAERLAWLDSEISKLTTRQQRLDEQLSGRSLKSDFGKLAAVREERLTVATELEALQRERPLVEAAREAEITRESRDRARIGGATALLDALPHLFTPEARRRPVLRHALDLRQIESLVTHARVEAQRLRQAGIDVPDFIDIRLNLKGDQ